MTKEPITQEARELAEKLFLEYEGRHHVRIEAEVRAAGHRFNRAMLYTTKYGGRIVEGLIDKYRWRDQLPVEKRDFNRKRNGGRNKFEHWLRGHIPNGIGLGDISE